MELAFPAAPADAVGDDEMAALDEQFDSVSVGDADPVSGFKGVER